VTVYPNLKLRLWRIGIRQNRLARLLGIDEAIVSKIINGQRRPSPQVRRRIAAVLEGDEKWLIEKPDGGPDGAARQFSGAGKRERPSA